MKGKSEIIFLFALIATTLLISLNVSAIDFLISPSINNETQSNQVVKCEWIPTSDYVGANITWFNGSQIFAPASGYTLENQTYLDDSYTRRDEVWTCAVNITDGIDYVAKNTTIIIKNSDPSNFLIFNYSNGINLGNTTKLYEDLETILLLNASDYDNDELSYGIYFNNILNSMVTNDLFTWTPTKDDVGIHNISFYAIDDYEGSETFKMFVTVIEVNDDPYFTNLANFTVNESQNFTYTLTVADEEEDYPIIFELLDQDGLPLQITTLSDTTAKLFFTRETNYSDVGNYTVTLKITDNRSGEKTVDMGIEIVTINHAPTINYIEDKAATQGDSYSFIINASEQGEDNDTLTFAVNPIGCIFPNPWTDITVTSDHSSNASVQVNAASLNNTHLACNFINISLSDGKETDWVNITLDLININDPPVIYNISNHPLNTLTDLDNLSIYAQTRFTYYINSTDIDYYVNGSESWNFTLNDSRIPISTEFANGQYMGLMDFTPDQSMIGNYSLKLTVTDLGGLTATKDFQLSILNNSAPYFLDLNLSFTCNEDENCFINFTEKNQPFDNEGDNITLTLNDTSVFSILQNSFINKTYNQSYVNNYTLQITLEDDKRASTTYLIEISIQNVNDVPIVTTENITSRIVSTYPFIYQFQHYDQDESLVPPYYINQDIKFYSNDTVHLNISESGLVNFTPTDDLIGNYSVNITIFDYLGANSSKIFNITIYPKKSGPLIRNVTPHSIPISFDWLAILPADNFTNINISENSTILFNVTVQQEEIEEPAAFSWLYDGETEYVAIGSTSYSKYFGFTESGIHTLQLYTNNSFYGSDTFTWNLNISNINRAPEMINPPPSLIINQTLTDSFYLFGTSDEPVFYDPDEDLDENDVISVNSGEAENLIFGIKNISDSSILDITFADGKITFTPKATGLVYVWYNISDGDKNYTMTNYVVYNVTYTPEGNDVVQIPVTRPRDNPVYYQVEVEKIINLDILTPSSVTTYMNNTVEIPIKIENTGNETLNMINLYASSNMSDLEFKFDDETIDMLIPKESFDTKLTITSFNTHGSYNVNIFANVSNPKFSDKAVVLVSSSEKSKGDETATNTKITFASDLLSSNSQCLELNEALEEIRNGLGVSIDYVTAASMLDDIIETCRYLTSTKEAIQEKPDMIIIDINRFIANKTLLYSVISIISILFLSLGYAVYYSNKKID
ncbi:hypothetical protein C0585_01090 [Candidatus Woesearchaeota archaeon]|nr:MAG: hypothetical protein C0585_01090 [Candidatus Woesearchaeota archaeon]